MSGDGTVAKAIKSVTVEKVPSLIDEIISAIPESPETFDVELPTGHKFVFKLYQSHSEWEVAKRRFTRFAEAEVGPTREATELLKGSDPVTKAIADLLAAQCVEPKITALDFLTLAQKRWVIFDSIYRAFDSHQQMATRKAYTAAINEGKIELSETSAGETS